MNEEYLKITFVKYIFLFDFLNFNHTGFYWKRVTKLMLALIHARFRFLLLEYPGYIRIILVEQRTEKT